MVHFIDYITAYFFGALFFLTDSVDIEASSVFFRQRLVTIDLSLEVCYYSCRRKNANM